MPPVSLEETLMTCCYLKACFMDIPWRFRVLPNSARLSFQETCLGTTDLHTMQRQPVHHHPL